MRVSVSGTGSVTCLGAGTAKIWKSALSRSTGIVEGQGQVSKELISETIDSCSNEFPFRSETLSLLEDWPRTKLLVMSLVSIGEAFRKAGWNNLTENDGIILGTTTGFLGRWEKGAQDFLSDKRSPSAFAKEFQSQPLGNVLEELRKIINHKGPSLTISSACSASTQALIMGAHWINEGKVKRCLVGGAETLCDLTLKGFNSFQLLSSSPAKPFDKNRSGINLSEGAGFLCLTSSADDEMAQILGGGLSSDAHHMTGPEPSGNGILKAMEIALHQAELPAEKIDWIYAHGTGSAQNDAAESKAINKLFLHKPWVSSTKGSHGHALGATGAIEACLAVESFKNNLNLPTTGLDEIDPELVAIQSKPTSSSDLKYIMKTTLGFGGTNAAVVLGAPEK